ncbi:ankyrin repeat-containing protein 10_01 [Ectocarpus siliculosus]|uniref:Ankyrin repeat-containing protein 10_01 n=1 Tax=Ectocarpus siliculosus TaxID=2880 RepID=D8LMB2_ECTSI|nr:ankyrin repeat-containing protein 10_01 [Ectocarpus siliculosus]|eukprot:CBN77522.1 ankyrin repeat-containing protein 10_01 [Ectocarpus siliculosus]
MMVACESSSGTSTKLEMLHSLLRAGAAPALEIELGALAIHFAAARCETQVVELLLSKAPSTLNNADNHGYSPLGAAALQGRESTLSLLLSAGASDRIVWATKGVSALHEAIGIGKGNSVRFLLENGLEAVGGLPAIAGAMAVSVWYGYIDILEMLLNVEGGEKQEVWANQHVYFAHDGSLLRGVPGPTMATKFEWLPILHYAAKYCSIPALRILLSAGADTETCDLKGKLAVDHIGSLLPDDKRNGSMEAAVQQMLQKGPAFRVRSRAWPDTTATHGGASKVTQSSSNPVPKKTRTGARTFGKIGQRLDISRSFDWYVRKADLRFTR